MPKVQEIKILNVDEKPYAVETMSEQVQQLVEIYNEWAQDQSDAKQNLMLVSAAMERLSQQIIEIVRKEQAEAEAEAAGEGEEAGDDAKTPVGE